MGAFSRRNVATGLAVFHAVDSVACATVPYIKNDLDRLGCPPELQRALPFIKAAAAIGLTVGRRRPALGRLTAGALTAYFGCAVGVHLRAGDPPQKVAPAALMGLVSASVAVRGIETKSPETAE